MMAGGEGVSDQKGINSIPLVTLIYGRTNKNTHNPCMEILTQRVSLSQHSRQMPHLLY